MALEEQMRYEIRKLEKEISLLDEELQKLYRKTEKILDLRRKKEHDLRILRENFGEPQDDIDIRLTLSKMLRERA